MNAFFDWANGYANGITAIATVVLTMFAGIEIGREVMRRKRDQIAARVNALGPAWLARRTCEQAYLEASRAVYRRQWAQSVGSSEVFDRLEAQMLEVLRLTTLADEKTRITGYAAFNHFLAYADRVNALSVQEGSVADGAGGRVYSADDDIQSETAFVQAVTSLEGVISRLSQLAPRQLHEPELPSAPSIGSRTRLPE